jgi:protein O-mannosyl-transferase
MSASQRATAYSRQSLIAGAGLALLAFAAYSNSFSGEFILDDQSSIVKNPSLARIWPPWAPLTSAAAGGTRGRPFANLTFALNHWVGGTAVGGYHAVNLAIHVLAGLALFGVMRRTLCRPVLAARFEAASGSLAFAVAALWLVHPLATESVTYLSQRTESLMGLCYLATLYCVVRGAESGAQHSGRWYALGVIACLLGMASKEVMITAPVVVFLYDRTFLAGSFGSAWKQRWRLYLGLASGWVLLGFLMMGVGTRGAGLGLGVGAGSYALCECRAIVGYLGLSVWPHPLVFDYGADLGPDGPAVAPYALIILALGICTLLALRYRPAVGFAMFWFLAILAPTSSFVPVALQPVAENRMYLPLAAVIALAATGAYALIGRWSLALLGGLALCLGWATHERNEDYRSAIRIWEDTVDKRPMNARARCNLGNALLGDGQFAAGTKQLEEALRISPDDPDANLDLGVALARAGRLADAVPRIQRALRSNPAMAEAHFNLGWLDAGMGRIPEAIEEYARAIALRPDYFDAHCNIADLLVKGGRYAEAIPHYEAALSVGPQEPELYFNLAYARIRTGFVADAIGDYRRALQLKPDFAEARRNLDLLERMTRENGGAGPR